MSRTILFITFFSIFVSSTVSSESVLQSNGQLVIDGHVHITNTSVLQYLWANPNQTANCPCAPPCLCNWTINDYVTINNQGPIPTTKFVFVEVDVNSTQWLDEATYIQSLSSNNPNLGGIVAQQPPGFAQPGTDFNYLTTAIQNLTLLPLVKGIRVSNISYNDPDQIQLLINHTSILVQYGLSMDINTGIITPGVVDGILNLTNTYPQGIFVLDHVGSAPVLGNSTLQSLWTNSIQRLSKQPNLYIKVGGILQGYKSSGIIPTVEQVQPWVTTAITNFGFTNSFYEGNWFFCNWGTPSNLTILSVWENMIDSILTDMNAGPGTVARNQFLYQTAMKAYRVAM